MASVSEDNDIMSQSVEEPKSKNRRWGVVVGAIVVILVTIAAGTTAGLVALRRPPRSSTTDDGALGEGDTPVSPTPASSSPTGSSQTVERPGIATLFPTRSPPPTSMMPTVTANPTFTGEPTVRSGTHITGIPQLIIDPISFPPGMNNPSTRPPAARPEVSPTVPVRPSGFKPGARWKRVLADLYSPFVEDTSFGDSIDLSEEASSLIVGSPWFNTVFVFDRVQAENGTTDSWSQVSDPIQMGGMRQVAISSRGNLVAVAGNTTVDTRERQLSLLDTRWSSRGNLSVTNTSLMAFSSRGYFLAVTQDQAEGSRVRVFRWERQDWAESFNQTWNETITGLSLSENGELLALGFPTCVRIISRSGGSWELEHELVLGNDTSASTKVSLSDQDSVLGIASSSEFVTVWTRAPTINFSSVWAQRGRYLPYKALEIAVSPSGQSVGIIDAEGVANVFQWDDEQWVQLSDDIDFAFYKSIALHYDGSMMALGGVDQINGTGLVSLFIWA